MEPAWPRALAEAALAAHEFQRPRKRIETEADLQRFLGSEAHDGFLGFVVALAVAVAGTKLTDAVPVSPFLGGLIGVLERMEAWVDEIPPSAHARRYGNPAYRTWHARMTAESRGLVEGLLPPGRHTAVGELLQYLQESFGNATRIDYGTGHEANFLAFLYCLARLGLIAEADAAAVVNRVFVAYLRLVQKVQLTYFLEPAGSHGVWGLDDYQFLSFLFGAAQLMKHQYLRPKSVHNQEILDEYGDDYLYLKAVRFVQQVKRGPLKQTSPMLTDISAVARWQKVTTGLIKMYKGEVLSKVPIMQHFFFGSLLAW